MKILFFTCDIHFMGGGERVTSYMASWLAENGDDVTILSMDCYVKDRLFPLNPNIKLDYLNVRNTKYLSKIKVISRFNQYLHEKSFDLIIGIGTYASCVIGLNHRKSVTIGCEHNSFNSAPLLWAIIRKCTYKRLSSVVVLTNTDLPNVTKLNKNAFVIPNSVPIQKKKALLNNKSIIAIGKLYYQKGFDRMIKAFSKFAIIDKEWNLEIVGDGEDREQILKLINDYDLAKRVKLSEPTSNVREKYLNSSIYLMTSRFEGLPMVLLEAQSYGLPIISYNCMTGPSDVVVDSKNGFLIEDGNEKALVDALLEISSNEDLRKQMGLNSHILSQRFSPESVFDKWEILFKYLNLR